MNVAADNVQYDYPYAFRDDPLMNASEAVTDALRRTTQLMQQELERSVLSTQLLGAVRTPVFA
jgi:hypothetical protein